MAMENSDFTRFGGISGSTVNAFVSSATLVSAIPVILFVGLAMLIITFILPDVIEWLAGPIMLLIVAIPVARFAIPARNGHLQEGFISSHVDMQESFAFAMRYLVANLIWFIPAVLLGFAAGSLMTGSGSAGFGMMSMIASTGGILLLIIFILSILGPLLDVLVATATDSLGEIFDKELWMSFITDFRPDFLVFCTNAIGAVIIFWMIFALPLLLVVAVAYAISSTLGTILLTFVMLLPGAISPIILGRMAGAMVYAIEQDIADYAEDVELSEMHITSEPADEESSPLVADTPAIPSQQVAEEQINAVESNTQSAATTTPAAERDSVPNNEQSHGSQYNLLVRKIDKLETLKVANALTMAQNAQNKDANDPYPFAEEVFIHLFADDAEKALQVANRALPKAINAQETKLCIKLFSDLGSQRTQLKLAPPIVEKLIQKLQNEKQFLLAVHALLILIKMQPDEQKHLERILDIADQAERNNKANQAKKIYQFFIKKFTGNNLVAVAKKSLSELDQNKP